MKQRLLRQKWSLALNETLKRISRKSRMERSMVFIAAFLMVFDMGHFSRQKAFEALKYLHDVEEQCAARILNQLFKPLFERLALVLAHKISWIYFQFHQLRLCLGAYLSSVVEFVNVSRGFGQLLHQSRKSGITHFERTNRRFPKRSINHRSLLIWIDFPPSAPPFLFWSFLKSRISSEHRQRIWKLLKKSPAGVSTAIDVVTFFDRNASEKNATPISF